MMGRGTFHDPEVARRINQDFVPTWRNHHPGYRVGKIDAGTFEQFAGKKAAPHEGDFAPDLASELPNGAANDNVVTLIATAEGELLHVVGGLWHPKDYLVELEFARSVRDAIAAAGSDSKARSEAFVKMHRDRLPHLPSGIGEMGRQVLARAHRTLIDQPLRSAAPGEGVDEFAGLHLSSFEEKSQRLQRALERWQKEGRDPSPIVRQMKEVPPLMKCGRAAEAEAILDRALETAEK